MKRLLQIGNIVSLVFALVANAVVSTQLINVPAINQISDKYGTLLTPATYAFSVWSLVYALLIVFVIYQARDLFKPSAKNDLPARVGPYFIIASLCNGIWTYVFVKEWVGASVFILVALTASLFVLLARLRIATADAPRSVIAAVWWPLLLYTGWVTVATVVNIASWFAYRGYVLGPLVASLVLIVLAVGLLGLLYKRNVRELLMTSTWGIAAIGVQQSGADDNRLVGVTALTVAAVLVINIIIHAYVHRNRNPFYNKALH